MSGGFLGTAAPLAADLVLLLEIGMGVALLVGAWLARTQRFRQHAWCQSGVLLFNLVIITLMMVPSFRDHLFPKLPEKIGRSYYGLATVHATVGTIAELWGLYILLAAGTNWLPTKIRLTGFKLWMRSLLVFWWLVLVLGIVTYARWYVPMR